MRIAVWHNLPSGGGKRALHDHVHGLASRGHEVEVWCPSTADLTFLPLGEIAPEHVLPLPGRKPAFRYALKVLSPVAFHTRNWLATVEEHTRQCATEISRGAFDVVLAASSMHSAVAPIALHLDIPSILYIQEPSRHLFEAMPESPWAAKVHPKRQSARAILEKVEDLVRLEAYRLQVRHEVDSIRAFTKILTNSRYSRESVLRAYGVDSTVCYLGVDTRQFAPKPVARENLVVGVGSIGRHKRVEVAIETISRLTNERPRLIWAGNESDVAYSAEMAKLAQDCRVNLELKVRVSDAELITLLNRASAMVYAPRLEPFGYAPLEAAACRLPVVALAEGGVRESVIHRLTGYLADSEAQLADYLDVLLHDKEQASEMGAAARARIEAQWDLESAVDRLEANLRSVV